MKTDLPESKLLTEEVRIQIPEQMSDIEKMLADRAFSHVVKQGEIDEVNRLARYGGKEIVLNSPLCRIVLSAAVDTKWFFEDRLAELDMQEPQWRRLALSARDQGDSLTEEGHISAWLQLRGVYKWMSGASREQSLGFIDTSCF